MVVYFDDIRQNTWSISDRSLWSSMNSGLATPSSAYTTLSKSHLSQTTDRTDWSTLWKLAVPPRIKI